MRLAEFFAHLKEDFTRPLYLVFGNEPILIDRLLKTLQKKVIGDSPSDFSFSQSYGSSLKASEIISEAEQIPFLSEKRLMIVKEVERLSSEDQNSLADYCQNSSPTTTLVFAASTVDKRTRLYKTLMKKGEVLEVSTPPEEDLRNWVIKRFEKEGKSISLDALELLMASSGGTLTLLAQEVEKLVLFTKGLQKVSLRDVSEIATQSKIKTVFDLWEAIAFQNRDQAYQILRKLQLLRTTLPELIGLFRWQLARLFQGEELIQSGRVSKKEISSTLKIPFFVADKFIQQVKKFPKRRIWEAYEAILKADEEVKTGSRQEREIFDFLLYRLMA